MHEIIAQRMSSTQRIDHFPFVSFAEHLSPPEWNMNCLSGPVNLSLPLCINSLITEFADSLRLSRIPYDQIERHNSWQEMFVPPPPSWRDGAPSSLAPWRPLCYFQACHLWAGDLHSPNRACCHVNVPPAVGGWTFNIRWLHRGAPHSCFCLM